MRASILIGVHNEGDRLWKTVESVLSTMKKLDAEVLVADDGSTDGSLVELKRRFPRITVVEGGKRMGVAAARGLAAGRARGNVLIFLDGHTKPEAGALERLVSSVEKTKGEAVITPRIIGLDETTWKSHPQQIGHGYALDLETFDCWWLPLQKMKEVKEAGRTFYESPALVGCALAVSRELYDRLWGFDPHMRQWGVEDLDFSLKAWTMGARILHDPEATVAHRFQRDFADYEVNAEYPLANQIRSARKNFTQSAWEDWLTRAQQKQRLRLKGHPEGLWASAWEVFQRDRQSAEHERAYLLSHRTQDEFWFSKNFDRSWPSMGGAATFSKPLTIPQFAPRELFAQAQPSKEPPITLQIQNTYTKKILSGGSKTTKAAAGQQIGLTAKASNGSAVTVLQWTLGSVVGGYTPVSGGSGTTTPFTAYTDTAINFYWWIPGSVTVSLRAKLSTGETQTVTANFNVLIPNLTPDTITNGSVDIGAVVRSGVTYPVNVRFGQEVDPLWGILYGYQSSEVDDAAGRLCFVQLVSISQYRWNNSNQLCIIGTGGEQMLDSTFPVDGDYGTNSYFSQPDSPSFPLDASLSKVYNTGAFEVWLMFKPTPTPDFGSTPIWVPISQMTWNTEATAVRVTTPGVNSWSISSSSPITNSGFSTTSVTFPRWSSTITGATLAEQAEACFQ